LKGTTWEIKTTLFHYPIVEFLSDKKVSISDIGRNLEVTREYYDYKIDNSIVEIFKIYNKITVYKYYGRIQNDTTLILSYANDELSNKEGDTYATLKR